MEQNTRGDSGADQDLHLSADDLAGVVEALTGERVIARPVPGDLRRSDLRRSRCLRPELIAP
ncbi:hypothetical protein [Rhodococcus koreensis]|uniref:hypothetical protein n=1 Tax=Rhodococcus koreensis TaxID=99653 RepID=UPI00367157BF